jgi:enterochelin esterase-like enzyme
MRGLAALVSLLAACGGAPPAPAPPPLEVTVASFIEGQAFAGKDVAPAPRGTLVVGWLTTEEAAARREGRPDLAGFRRLMERLQVVGPVDLARTPRVAYRVEAPRDAHPFVVLDVERSFWATLFGGGHGLVGIGPRGGDEVALAGAKPEPPAPEPCAGDRYQLVVAQAPETEGAVKNPTARRFCAYLPPSYREAPSRRYPLVLMLPGLFSGEMSRLRGKNGAAEVADAIARETGREVIVVGVDTSTRSGSTYLEDSAVTGAFDTFLAGRGLEAIDAALRTIPERGARALVGNSTGGFNALSFGMRHPERFSAIGSCSPDALDLEGWLLADDHRIKPWIRAWVRLEDGLGGPGQMTSYAADWSPDPAQARGFAWPFQPQSGNVDQTVLARWKAHTPAGMLEDASMRARTRYAFGGRIFITVARGDEFDLFEPARRFSEALTKHGIEHTFRPTDGGHFEGAAERVGAAIRFVVARLVPAR